MHRKFIPSSKTNPCPVCGRTKDGDCRVTVDKQLVLCHTYSDSLRLWEEVNGWKFIGSSYNPLWGKFIRVKEDWQKPCRPAGKRYWDYHDSQNQKIVRVHRQDFGDSRPKRIWQESLIKGKSPAETLTFALPYRYTECISAQSRGCPVFWVEGEACADSLWDIGIAATTTIGGSGQYRSHQYRNLFDDKALVICPDWDETGFKYAEAVAQDYPEARWLYLDVAFARGLSIPKNGGLDIADWIGILAERGLPKDEIKQLILRSTESRRKGFAPTNTPAEDKPRELLDYELLKNRFGDRLRYNLLTKEVELDGQQIEVGEAKLLFAIDHAIRLKSSKEDIASITTKLAKEHAYSPVRDYLERVWLSYRSNPHPLESLHRRIETYLGCDNSVLRLLVIKTLVGAVARAYEPGVKVDTILILCGPQGCRKSSFWRALASAAWFDDSLDLESLGDKDSRLQLHASWIVEFQEAEQMFATKQQRGTLKALLSTCRDRIRRPYGRVFETLERHFVVVGTTNHLQFLDDPTGNRRFWIVPVRAPIPLERVEAERDQIWAEAVALYKSGFAWWLSSSEQQAVSDLTSRHENEDPWQEPIANFLAARSETTMAEIFSDVLGVEMSQREQYKQRRIAAILHQLGWERRHGMRGKKWVKTEPQQLNSHGSSEQTDKQCSPFIQNFDQYGSYGSYGSYSTQKPDKSSTSGDDPSDDPYNGKVGDGSLGDDPNAHHDPPKKEEFCQGVIIETSISQALRRLDDPNDSYDPSKVLFTQNFSGNGSEWDLYCDGYE
ncbi:VapE domain-containing protein [Thermosynechococcus sp. PKX82]|uniref:VapE domain-containing protein n=1 Tax=Thermosynechococcus sp. PKX82 TaxID=3074086 RepID=UPI00287351BD|nr:VapE domain-containing protein [Thermosynechococcus sp. PKX82]WNC30626.1 VapE family protein [Thermosynechococcus sp. PKX82]